MATFLGLSEEEMQLFLDEMEEHLETLETELLNIEDHGADADRIGRLFRAAHTIKGAAATVGLEGMASLTHAMETLFDQMRSGVLSPRPAVVTLLLQAVDYLRDGLVQVEAEEMPQALPGHLLQALAAVNENEIGSTSEADTGEEFADITPSAADKEAAAASEAVLTSDDVEVESDSNTQEVMATNPQVDNVPTTTSHVVTVNFASDCQLPAVRALQVLLAMKTLGDIAGSDPAESDIRSGNVTDSITLEVLTESNEAAIRAALARIGDLATIAVDNASAVALGPAVGDIVKVENPTHKQAPAISTPPAQTNSQVRDEAHQVSDRTIRVDVGLLDDLMNLVGELVIDRGRLGGIGHALAQFVEQQELSEELSRVSAHLARVTGTLQETVLKARMLPVKLVFKKFPRMVRDLAQQMGKHVDFRMVGEETELDRSLLEVLGDPLMHLLRNALDHGIESPDERKNKGKPETAVLQLSAGYEENQVVILVQDDGHGIDPERIRSVAVRKGLLTAERAKELGEQEAIQLLFAPGFSTAQQITDISGRGVGLDVVRRNIERVGGRIEVESQLGQGSTFKLLLPLTLATIQSLLVKVGHDTLALPLSTTAEVMQVEPANMTLVGSCWMTRVRGRVVPLVWLEQFMTPHFQPARDNKQLVAVLVNYKGESVGLVVDRLIGEQEVVVKGLGEFFGQVKGISGVTILGDGRLALIVDTAGLVGMLMAEIGRGTALGGDTGRKGLGG